MELSSITIDLIDAPVEVTAHANAMTGHILPDHGQVQVIVKQGGPGSPRLTLFANQTQLLSLAEQLRDIAHQAELEQMTAVRS